MLLKRLVVAFVSVAVVSLVAAGVHAAPAPQAKAAAKVDINSASQADLEKLPGIGAATARKIIAGRPYHAVGDLSKAGVSKRTIEKLTPLVSVGAAAPAAAAVAPAPKPRAEKTEAAKGETVVAQTPPVKGMVWVNLETKVFHVEGDQWYGKTKHGKFMTEQDAIKAGYRAAKEGGKKK